MRYRLVMMTLAGKTHHVEFASYERAWAEYVWITGMIGRGVDEECITWRGEREIWVLNPANVVELAMGRLTGTDEVQPVALHRSKFATLLDEFMDENDGVLRRLAAS